MALHAALDWLLIAICAITYGLLFGEAVGVLRRLLALKAKVERLADQPLAAALPKAQADVERIGTAVTALPALLLRATLATARIRGAMIAAVGFARSVLPH